MSQQLVPYPTTVPQSTQVEAQFAISFSGVLMGTLLVLYVVQQGMKVFKGMEMEKPF